MSILTPFLKSGNRVCSYIPCGRAKDRVAKSSDHPGQGPLQAEREGGGVRPHGHPLQDA